MLLLPRRAARYDVVARQRCRHAAALRHAGAADDAAASCYYAITPQKGYAYASEMSYDTPARCARAIA